MESVRLERVIRTKMRRCQEKAGTSWLLARSGQRSPIRIRVLTTTCHFPALPREELFSIRPHLRKEGGRIRKRRSSTFSKRPTGAILNGGLKRSIMTNIISGLAKAVTRLGPNGTVTQPA